MIDTKSALVAPREKLMNIMITNNQEKDDKHKKFMNMTIMIN
jgi:hypothetical protein